MTRAGVEVTGSSRDNARRRLVWAAKQPPGAGRRAAKAALAEVLLGRGQGAAAGAGGLGREVLRAASMLVQLDGLERHGELVNGVHRYSPAMREELLAMSAASIDRHPAPAKASDKAARDLHDEALAANMLAPGQTADLISYRDELNAAQIAGSMAFKEAARKANPVLLKPATDKTGQLDLDSLPTALPEVHNGIRIRTS